MSVEMHFWLDPHWSSSKAAYRKPPPDWFFLILLWIAVTAYCVHNTN